MLFRLATAGPPSVTATPFVPWVVAGVDTKDHGSVGRRAGVASELASDAVSDVMLGRRRPLVPPARVFSFAVVFTVGDR